MCAIAPEHAGTTSAHINCEAKVCTVISADLQQQERGRPTRNQFEESELHLSQAFRTVPDSPCIDLHSPGDPPRSIPTARRLDSATR